ncbi:hypothetical protein ncot_00145 [Nocardioides sp. JQ2195]|uniref:plasmid mobilization protein n=1 Tax=Nocardioides sp. JQ2195 TaxID=2592334 RepID=UPI00143E299F|nr:hypothetical protein [Nocardioides sp. JQ2195]QIX25169.1 hypothetical protein ncot_00145 [Nocardioides sp. JQ2195]
MSKRDDVELAKFYNETEDLSGFDEGNPVPVTVKRSVTISVRFSDEEIAELRARADAAGIKVTSYIRDAALDASRPVDRDELGALARGLEKQAHRVSQILTRGA